MNVARFVKSIVLAGTEKCEREEDKKRIRIINCLSFVTALAAFSMGSLLYMFTGTLRIEIPAVCEGLLFSFVIFLNWKHLNNTANLFFLLTHTISALYFGILLGPLINISLIAVFLFGLSFMAFKSTRLRFIAICATGLTLILLEVNFYLQIFHPVQLSLENQFLLRWIALAVFLVSTCW